MNTYRQRQKGYSLTFTVEKIGNAESQTIQLMTVTMNKKELKSKYILVTVIGGRIRPYHFKKILEDVEFRKKFLVEGYPHCEETFSYITSKGITCSCDSILKRFNKIQSPKAIDYMSLLSHGPDKFSNYTLGDLERKLPIEVVEKVRSVFDSETRMRSTLRWVLRGLSVEHAINRELLNILNEETYRTKFVEKHLTGNLKEEVKKLSSNVQDS